MPDKFDQIDRQLVQKALENHLETNLARVGNKRILLKDNSGNCYCTLGGIDFWHGIPREIIEFENYNFKHMFLVIAKKYRQHMDIFIGSMTHLVDDKKRLKANKDKYFFNIKNIEGDRLSIKELPTFHLHKIERIEYSQKDKDSVKRLNDFAKLTKNMSQIELTELLATLKELRNQSENSL